MNFRNISSWCIQNPVPPIVLFIGLLLAGVVSFMRMDVTGNPDIDFPAAIVSVSQPGAAPAEMENQITQRVESAIRGVDGVDDPRTSLGGLLDVVAGDVALLLEDLRDVRLDLAVRHHDGVVVRRVRVTQTREHVCDRVGHGHITAFGLSHRGFSRGSTPRQAARTPTGPTA